MTRIWIISVFLLSMFLLMLILLMISPQSDVVFRICLCSCRYYILVFNLHRFPAKWLLHKMLYWKDRSNLRKNCFSLHIARNNPRAEKRRNFTAHNISLCPSLYVWQNHKYFKNKVQVSIKTFEKKNVAKQRNRNTQVKGIGNSLRNLLPTQIVSLVSNI